MTTGTMMMKWMMMIRRRKNGVKDFNALGQLLKPIIKSIKPRK